MVGLVVLPPKDEPPMDELPTPGRGDGPMPGVDPMVGLVVVPGVPMVGLVVLPPRDEPPNPGVAPSVPEAPGLGNVEPGKGDTLLPMAELPMPGDAEPGRALLGTTGMPMVPVEVPVDGPAVPGVKVLCAKQTGTTAVRTVATAARAVTTALRAVAIARAINLRLNVIACAPRKVVGNSEQNSILRNRALTPISS